VCNSSQHCLQVISASLKVSPGHPYAAKFNQVKLLLGSAQHEGDCGGPGSVALFRSPAHCTPILDSLVFLDTISSSVFVVTSLTSYVEYCEYAGSVAMTMGVYDRQRQKPVSAYAEAIKASQAKSFSGRRDVLRAFRTRLDDDRRDALTLLPLTARGAVRKITGGAQFGVSTAVITVLQGMEEMLQHVENIFAACGLDPSVLTSVHPSVFTELPCEHFFIAARQGRNPMPPLIDYLQRRVVTIREYEKRFCESGFNYSLMRGFQRLHYQAVRRDLSLPASLVAIEPPPCQRRLRPLLQAAAPCSAADEDLLAVLLSLAKGLAQQTTRYPYFFFGYDMGECCV